MSNANPVIDPAFDPASFWRYSGGANGSARARRTELELVVEVLLCLDRGVGQTSVLLRKANLTHGKLTTILAQLEERGLIGHDSKDGRPVYRIETRGRELLSEFLTFRSLLERTYGFSL